MPYVLAMKTTCGALLVALGLGSAGLVAASAAVGELTGERMPYDAFERMPSTKLEVPGAVLDVRFASNDLALPRSAVLGWVGKSGEIVAAFYGKFPVEEARVLIVPVAGRGVRGGTAFGYRGAAVRLLVGKESTEDDLWRDWKIVHEMIHLALPAVNERHLWLSEGLSVYLEPVARAKAGYMPVKTVWSDLVRDTPQGLPYPGQGGLDQTPSWGRTYWGGALFALLADVEIRKRTENRFGLQDAVKGIVTAGGTTEVGWPILRILVAGDEAVGVPVLTELYRQMRATPVSPELDALWASLGVVPRGAGQIAFDEKAPLAYIRRAITAPNARASSLSP